MAKHNINGKIGEEIACDFLLSKGYLIREINWRASRAEVDIIAMDGGVLVFVEVKTRKNPGFGLPTEFVTPRKEEMMNYAASVYMELHDFEGEIRFDIIGILVGEEGSLPVIRHYPDAFFPDWNEA